MTVALLLASTGDAQGTPSLVFVSPTGSDAASCIRSQPCASFDRAYRAAEPGAVVEVAAGDYPQQTIKPQAGKGSGPDVVYRPAAGAAVRVAGVVITASRLELRDMQTRWAVRGASNVTLRNIRADGPVSIYGASNVSVLGGEIYSPTPVRTDSQIASLAGQVPTNVTFDRVTFRDWVDIGPGQKHHIECLQVGSAINLTVRNSTFRNCATHDIFIRSWGKANKSPHPLQNLVIENNWFGRTNGGYASVAVNDDLWRDSPTSFTLRSNSALQTFNVDVRNGRASVTGNILPTMSRFLCSKYGQGYDYNLYERGTPCGPHDRVGDPRYADPEALDLHLRLGSAAIGAGNPADHPAEDIDGDSRPQRWAPDAGADEYDRASLALGRSIGAVTLDAREADVSVFYGSPASVVSTRTGVKQTRRALYQLHGGTLWVTYAGNVVVGVGTSSPYYTTPQGVGVGSTVQSLAGGKALVWVGCRRALRRMYGNAAVFVVPAGGKKGTRIAQISMFRRGYEVC